MKKISFLCLSFSVLIFCNFSANASEVVYENEEKEIIENLIIVSSDTIYLNDGSYITTTLYSSISNNARSSSYTKTGSKDVVKQNGDGSIVWKYTLTGYYTIETGVSVTCYNAVYSQTINTSGWSFSNGSATYSGNTAFGKGTFKDKLLFVTLQTVNIDINVKCDVNGNLS